MSVETLDSDRVNFLVWRYLRESNYNEAALKLQKEWRRLDQVDGRDPANLPFAHHVKHHALITLLQNGLVSQSYERELQQEEGEPISTIGVFGPLKPSSNAPSPVAGAAVDDDTIIDDAGLEISRKRPHEWQNHQDQNESSAKRARLSNGVEDENAMDLDGEHELDDEAQTYYPSPAEVERPITPIITRGPEEGTQVDKVIELTGSTAFYSLTDPAEDSINNNNSALASEAILLHCAWNPQDPTVLATAGTDALARLWTFTRGTSPTSDLHETPPSPHVNGNAPQRSPPFISLIKAHDPSDLSVTAIAWASDGKALALAVDSRNESTTNLMIMSLGGNEIQKFDGLESTITCLRWNPQNNMLLVLFHDETEGSSVNLFSLQSDSLLARNEIFHTAKEHVGPEGRNQQILDAIWMSENEFVICGENLLRTFKLFDGQVFSSLKYNTRDCQGIVNMAYDARSQLIATGSEGGTVDVWDMKGQRRSFSAHQGMVTALAWQTPLYQPLVGEESEVLLASAGDDAVISIWNVHGLETKPKRSMTMELPVEALAFTPDGAFLTGATPIKILIWKIDEMGPPRACWIRGNDRGWATPKSNGSDAVEHHHSLCWNASGQKLAYGAANQLAIIDFNG